MNTKSERLVLKLPARLEVRVAPAEWSAFDAAANADNETISAWAKRALYRAARNAGIEPDDWDDVIQAFDDAAADSGLNRSSWVRQVLLRRAESADVAPGDLLTRRMTWLPRDT